MFRLAERSAVRRRATTLIELLVVVALIGLLMSALIPSIKRSMTLARDTVCKHNLREIGHSLMLYRYENDGWLPVPRERSGPTPFRKSYLPWWDPLFPTYIGDLSVLTCPEDPYAHLLKNLRTWEPDALDRADCGSYGVNAFPMIAGEGMLADLDRRGPSRPWDTILLGDLGPDYQRTTQGPRPVETPSPWDKAGLLYWDDSPVPGKGPPWLTVRHGCGINILTADTGLRSARTCPILQEPLSRVYSRCAAGGCTFCNYLRLSHYSLARDRLFWWTGPPSTE